MATNVNEGLAKAYAVMIANGKRTLDDVKPTSLKKRVKELLAEAEK